MFKCAVYFEALAKISAHVAARTVVYCTRSKQFFQVFHSNDIISLYSQSSLVPCEQIDLLFFIALCLNLVMLPAAMASSFGIFCQKSSKGHNHSCKG
jgi:hypothetical protein